MGYAPIFERLRMSEKKVLQKKFGPKGEEVRERWRKGRGSIGFWGEQKYIQGLGE